jgi:hypothetical protein
MRSTALLAATAMVFFSAAWAQSEVKPLPPEPPKLAAQAAAKPAAQDAAKPAAKPSGPMSAARKARRGEDARHCLERPSNDEIIKCAEAYL